MESNRELLIPDTNQVIRPGYKVKLGRFDTTVWIVGFGWYSTSGNRPCCGWYLTSEQGKLTKPLQMTDLDDIYLVEIGYADADFGRPVEAIDQEVIDARLGADGVLYSTLGDSIRTQVANILKSCTSIMPLASIKDAPIEGQSNVLYIDMSETLMYAWIDNRYVPLSSEGAVVSKSDKNGYLNVDGEDIEVYHPAPIDSIVSSESTRAVQSKAVHQYVSQEVAAINAELQEIRNILSKCILYDIIE